MILTKISAPHQHEPQLAILSTADKLQQDKQNHNYMYFITPTFQQDTTPQSSSGKTKLAGQKVKYQNTKHHTNKFIHHLNFRD